MFSGTHRMRQPPSPLVSMVEEANSRTGWADLEEQCTYGTDACQGRRRKV